MKTRLFGVQALAWFVAGLGGDKLKLGLQTGAWCIATAWSAFAADPGSITGTVDKPEKITAVAAIDRASGKRYAGILDAKLSRFTIDSLPLEADYDCVIDFEGARLEGVNLKVPRSDYEEEQPLSKEDIETIKTKVLAMNKFEDVVEVMAIRGNIQHAAVLLNKLRTTPFFGSKDGEMIWRPELWHFEKPEETWTKVQDEMFIVLYRERTSKDAFEKKSVTFDESLGGQRPTAKQPKVDLGKVILPSAEPGIRFRAEKN